MKDLCGRRVVFPAPHSGLQRAYLARQCGGGALRFHRSGSGVDSSARVFRSGAALGGGVGSHRSQLRLERGAPLVGALERGLELRQPHSHWPGGGRPYALSCSLVIVRAQNTLHAIFFTGDELQPALCSCHCCRRCRLRSLCPSERRVCVGGTFLRGPSCCHRRRRCCRTFSACAHRRGQLALERHDAVSKIRWGRRTRHARQCVSPPAALTFKSFDVDFQRRGVCDFGLRARRPSKRCLCALISSGSTGRSGPQRTRRGNVPCIDRCSGL
mmetsp:Transcript_29749/g.74405  ORF Transcript_29749/g.74405 Transcript_29749/m.74405 type:complete len:271 (-) Transcript_29749:1159-1971(-)